MKRAPKPPHLIPGERKIKWMGMMGKMNSARLFQSEEISNGREIAATETKNVYVKLFFSSEPSFTK